MSLKEDPGAGLLLCLGLGPPEAAACLHAACFPDEPWPAADLTVFTRTPGALAWHLTARPVAGKQALYALLLARAAGDEAEVLTLAVERASRRKGLATLLMNTLIQTLWRRKGRVLFLELARNNGSAETLYKRLGFRQVGTRQGYYRNGEDALLMSRSVAGNELFDSFYPNLTT
ncbi:MAG: GNAT family N-acetyltransferase [Rhodospirillales bacterium]|nr:GNAT family N-acetyltransferase [Rhodospirillales bacterium]